MGWKNTCEYYEARNRKMPRDDEGIGRNGRPENKKMSRKRFSISFSLFCVALSAQFPFNFLKKNN